MDNYSKKKLFEIPNSKTKQYSVGGAIFNPPSRSKVPSPTIGFTGLDGSIFGKPTETPSEEEQATTPQTLAEMIASSSNPELELQKYIYESGLEDVFSSYQKNIASLDKARQQDIADAYFVREMSKKYLGEYASNVGIGDVSGNLIDIYANYAENLSYIGQNYEKLKTGYESSMLSEEKDLSQKLLQTEIGLEMSEYQDTLLKAQSDIPSMIISGKYGEYATLEEYVGSLNLPEKYKAELLNWANQEKSYFETTSFVSVKGTGTSQEELTRFGLTAQPDIDLNYYSNESLLSDYAYVKNGIYYGVSSEIATLPTTALEDFNYQVGGMVVYKGETYVHMGNDEFHKIVQVEMEGAKIPRENGSLVVGDYNIRETGILYNGVKYKQGEWVWGLTNVNKIFKTTGYADEMLEAFGLEMNEKGNLVSLNPIETEWQFAFFNGQYYVIYYYQNGTDIDIKIARMKKAD